ncbi:MAG: polysaccharide deacetylase family protein [Saccharofermentans sp.]|nr:polysaccharide deacetylase family protein [Saccharofermentans sp.]
MIKAILTIDDMPQENTIPIIDYLLDLGIKPLFFTIGEFAEKHPDTVIYALKKGLIVGNHTYSHANLAEVSYEEGIEEIRKCDEILDAIYKQAGIERTVKVFRYPYLACGGENNKGFNDYLKELGYKKLDDRKVFASEYIENGWKFENGTNCSFDCQEYLLREGSDMTMEKILSNIDAAFGKEEQSKDQEHIILTHSHDLTDEREPGYYKTIVERMLKYGTEFIEPSFIDFWNIC